MTAHQRVSLPTVTYQQRYWVSVCDRNGRWTRIPRALLSHYVADRAAQALDAQQTEAYWNGGSMTYTEKAARAACAHLGFDYEELTRRNACGNTMRKPETIVNRWTVWRYMHHTKGYSYPEIAAGFGLKNHSSIIEGVRRLEDRWRKAQRKAAA